MQYMQKERREDELMNENKLAFEASEEESIIFEIVEENYSDDDMMFGACPPSSRCTKCK